MNPGYSGKTLAQKLGVKPELSFYAAADPGGDYHRLLGFKPKKYLKQREVDIIHYFVKSRAELQKKLLVYQKAIKTNGMIWISWPKKSSGVATDIIEDTIREIAHPLGLVDVKVCAVTDVWSGLKLMIRKESR